MAQQDKVNVVTYADDFIILAKRERDIFRAQEEVADVLTSMDLQLHPQKTQITNFRRGFRFLGHAFVGDLVVPTHKHKTLALPTVEREDAYRLIYTDPGEEVSQMQQAMVAALRAAHQPIPPPLYVVLGYRVRQWQPVTITSTER
jgi:CRISPR-associated protein Cas1